MDRLNCDIALKIAKMTPAQALVNLCQTNIFWYNLVVRNQRLLEKKMVQLNITRKMSTPPKEFEFFEGLEKKTVTVPSISRQVTPQFGHDPFQEAQFHFMIRGQRVNAPYQHYGCVLIELNNDNSLPNKTPDLIHSDDLCQYAFYGHCEPRTRYVNDLDGSLHELVDVLLRKVHLDCCVLDDPSVEDIVFLQACFEENRTTVKKLRVHFSADEIPQEFISLLVNVAGLEHLQATIVPAEILSCRPVKNCEVIDIQCGHFSARARTIDKDVPSANQDDAICDLKARDIKIRGVNFSAEGANRLIKRWLYQGKLRDVDIAIDPTKFKSNVVFADIYDADQIERSDYFLLAQRENNLKERSRISFMFHGDPKYSQVPPPRLWF